MGPDIFNSIKSDYYTRRYQIDPGSFEGHEIEIYAECNLNKEKINGERYGLDLCFSADGYETREFLIGTTFGESQKDKNSIDREVDCLIGEIISNQMFAEMLQNYLELQELWKDQQREKYGIDYSSEIPS